MFGQTPVLGGCSEVFQAFRLRGHNRRNNRVFPVNNAGISCMNRCALTRESALLENRVLCFRPGERIGSGKRSSNSNFVRRRFVLLFASEVRGDIYP